jgi:dihydrolipoamide dehydrogenase
VEKHEGGHDEIEFEHAILATGSLPTKIPGLSIDSDRVMDSTDALELADIPKTLLVIGGGYIGLEMGSVYSALGSKVTVVEMMPGLLTRCR